MKTGRSSGDNLHGQRDGTRNSLGEAMEKSGSRVIVLPRSRFPLPRGWRAIRGLALVLLALQAACASSRAGGAPDVVDLAFVDVTVVDVESGRSIPGRTVLIAGDRILAVSSAEDAPVPAGARVVGGQGKFLMPGLWDMHVHLSHAGATDLQLFVTRGVTGVRDMGGSWRTLQIWRERIQAGEIVGPRVKTAGPIVESARWLEAVRSIPEGRAYLEGNPRLGVETVEDAKAAVDSLARLGVDLVKVRNAPPREAYFALVEEARRRGLAVVGHLPRGGLGFEGVLEAGALGVEHVDGLTGELDEIADVDRGTLFARMAERGVWFTPTLVTELHRIYPAEAVEAIVEDSLGLLDPRRESISDTLLAFWRVQAELDKYEEKRDWGPILARALEYGRQMHAAGVPLLAGTDFGARLVYPGSSLHDELALLVERLGISPVEALRTATRNPARVLGEGEREGTVATGARADLLLLEADPLLDIRNTRRIDAVVLGGRLLTRDQLGELEDDARRR